MTNEQLSKRIAELYGIASYFIYEEHHREWLHDDSARCFGLMVEHGVSLSVDVGIHESFGVSTFLMGKVQLLSFERFADHNNDKALATRITILKCLLKMKE